MPEKELALTRRGFIAKTPLAIGAGMGAMTGAGFASGATAAPRPVARADRLPREVWIATLSQNRMEARNVDEMIRKMLARMEETLPYEPDIICLPEVFPFVNIPGDRPPLEECAEQPIGPISAPFAAFAEKHNCYVVCPIYTKAKGRFYNSAVFIDRSGKVLGEYRKAHPTIGEMERGVAPGPLDPPVFKTDFGVVGAQICFDIQWSDGWEALQRAGAEIIFWPSAFAGGQMINAAAQRHNCCVVSSTRKGVTKICDLAGEEVACTGNFAHWVCAPVNLEKVMIHTWPYSRRYKEIQAKYGRKIRLRLYHDEEWTVLESLSPELKVADVLKEFEIITHTEHIRAADQAQKKTR